MGVRCDHPGCKAVLTNNSSLREHSRTHTGDRPYACRHPSCAKTFKTSGQRSRHEIGHTDRRFACTYPGCTETFGREDSLQRHGNTHTRTSIYVCDVVGCGKPFLRKEALADHASVHTGERRPLYEKSKLCRCCNSLHGLCVTSSKCFSLQGGSA